MQKKPFITISGTAALRRFVMLALGLWTLLVAALIVNDYREGQAQAVEFALVEANAAYEKDLIYRRWAAGHGGIYVPVTEKTPPNPYLAHVPERDLATPGGRKLTLMNPAYMTRQVLEMSREQYGVRGHITSLKLLRPENAPDAWERVALKAFERGTREVHSVEQVDGQPQLRLMRPMRTEERCLKCHGAQGYREGDVRGGISTMVPMRRLFAEARGHWIDTSIGFGLLWCLGIAGIGAGSRSVTRRLSQQREAEEALQHQAELYAALSHTNQCIVARQQNL
jgi:hypothetical protein